MGKSFEVVWKMYGTAKVEADNMDEAIERASNELMGWSGFGLDLVEVSVDGADVDS